MRMKMMKTNTTLWIGDAPGGNYVPKFSAIAAMLPAGGLYYLMTSHDDWCGLFRGRACNCDPDIVVRPLTHDPR